MTRAFSRRFLVLSASLALAATAACGDDTPDDPLEVNGCTLATATDMTGSAAVDISAISAWSIPHAACVIVSPGTTVSWTGNFSGHPIAGGETGSADSASPITVAGPGSGNETISALLETAGEYPYFCISHLRSMQGVVYVQ